MLLRRPLVFLSGLVVALTAGSGLVSFSEPVSACEELRAWARSYADAHPSLEELAALDHRHRIAVLVTVRPAVRAALWQEHFRRFLDQGGLSPIQRALVTEAHGLATVDAYESNGGARAAMRALWPRVDRAFASDVTRRAWFDVTAFASGRPNVLRPSAQTGSDCECFTFQPSIGCPPGTRCKTSSCFPFAPGCGMSGVEDCNGACI